MADSGVPNIHEVAWIKDIGAKAENAWLFVRHASNGD